jgi:hypothetical protein
VKLENPFCSEEWEKRVLKKMKEKEKEYLIYGPSNDEDD